MSDYVHKMTVRAVLDNGELYSMDNEFTIVGVLHVSKGGGAASGSFSIPGGSPTEETPDFLLVQCVAGYSELNVNTTPQFYMEKTWCSVLPSNKAPTRDDNAGSTTNTDIITDFAFNYFLMGTSQVRYIALNCTAS